ncbi:hypothetical protein tinsulaeT_33210 [Thalassotalea insulae]|uniref:KfrA N-terminal DNA-binding domain-containing protein n=1 Tax=Thalassotalea insulae TaxID=2056778 RepID=A0ABQ6GZG7_9GAMM|nr:hypothetical protein [Thalassotalea insulae]GLX79981.1 hypothetical protein tinsulaeT_33210 [Thalassotalea insulae]
MTINDEILAIANQLANNGQKPTVALIKTRLSQSVPLPKIISVLKSWQHQPEFTEVENGSADSTELPRQEHIHAQISQAVEQAIQPLKNEIYELKALIQTLIDKQH